MQYMMSSLFIYIYNYIDIEIILYNASIRSIKYIMFPASGHQPGPEATHFAAFSFAEYILTSLAPEASKMQHFGT